jgi:hypothetical protein
MLVPLEIKKPTLRELKARLDWLRSYLSMLNEPEVRDAMEKVRLKRLPQTLLLEKDISELRAKQPVKKVKPRWPEGTPPEVLEVCKQYWSGTTEYDKYRIHCWNTELVCTSYPSGGYSDNGGWHATPACFHFLSLSEKEYGKPKRIGEDLEGRQSATDLALILVARTANLPKRV